MDFLNPDNCEIKMDIKIILSLIFLLTILVSCDNSENTFGNSQNNSSIQSIEVCLDKQIGENCTFESQRGLVEGSC